MTDSDVGGVKEESWYTCRDHVIMDVSLQNVLLGVGMSSVTYASQVTYGCNMAGSDVGGAAWTMSFQWSARSNLVMYIVVSCSELQWITGSCRELQCVAVCCSVLQCLSRYLRVRILYSELRCVAACYSVLQCLPSDLLVRVLQSMLRCVAACCSVLQRLPSDLLAYFLSTVCTISWIFYITLMCVSARACTYIYTTYTHDQT